MFTNVHKCSKMWHFIFVTRPFWCDTWNKCHICHIGSPPNVARCAQRSKLQLKLHAACKNIFIRYFSMSITSGLLLLTTFLTEILMTLWEQAWSSLYLNKHGLNMENQTALLIVCLFNSINLNPQFSKSLKPSTHYALYTLRYDDRDYTLKYG